MKKFFLMACLLTMSTALFAQQGATSVGINLNYGMHEDYKNFGVGVKTQYEFIDNVRGEASYNYFFKKDYLTMYDVNLNVHYLFNAGGLRIYPLAGVTLLGTSLEVLGVKASDSDLGFNVGGGLEFPITNALKFNAEAKYQIVKDWSMIF